MAFLNTKESGGAPIARYENVRRFKQFFGEFKRKYQGIRYLFLADASLVHKIDEPARLSADIQNGVILECPAGIQADAFLLEFVSQNPDTSVIVSNDRFKDQKPPATSLPRWRFPAMIIQGQVIIPNLADIVCAENEHSAVTVAKSEAGAIVE
nr:hypothetical protein [Candidatus Sigynarchaeota archaeon]